MKRAVAAVITLAVLLAGCSRSEQVPPMVQDRIRRILEIPGYEYVYRDVIYFDEERSFIVFKKRKAGIDLAAGRNEFVVIPSIVRGGFDLSAGRDPEGEPIRPSGTVLYVWLPEPVILDVIVEDSRSADYGYPDIVLRPESWKRVVEFVGGHVVGEVIEDGILETARENGKEALRGVFLGAGWEDVIFL